MAKQRKFGARTKSGRLSDAGKSKLRDRGTPESQTKREALVGSEADQTLAYTAPGCLYARGYIDQTQYIEAMEYRRLRWALYGQPWPCTSTGEATEDRLAELQRRFDTKVSALTADEKDVITNVCAFDQRPNWFYAKMLGLKILPEDVLEEELLLNGLDALAGRKHAKAA